MSTIRNTASTKLAEPKCEGNTVCIRLNELDNGDQETDMMMHPKENGRLKETAVEVDDEDLSDTVRPVSCSPLACCLLLHTAMSSHSSRFKQVLIGAVVAVFFVYFLVAVIFAVIKHCPYENDVSPLLIITCISLFLYVTSYVWNRFGDTLSKKILTPTNKGIDKHWKILRWFAVLIPLVGVVAIITTTVIKQPHNLISLVGMGFLLLVLILFSAAPKKIIWRPVIGGLILQFYVATLILKWDSGYQFFQFIGRQTQKFLAFTDVGSKFVFGDRFIDHMFVMQVLPVVIFFSCTISMLYHLGVMQRLISVIAFVMRCTLGTTAAESLCAAGNIFVGQTEAPIMIRPVLPLMTKSEIHTVMVGGFATIAGSVLAAYIKFGIAAEHLLCASVMNAPCSLAVSKLLYPETEESQLSKTKAAIKNKSQYGNLLEAAAAGASQAIPLVANIAVNLIAFTALLSFVNSTIAWFGTFVCLPDLSFEMICNYMLRPLVYIMGVSWEDAGLVAELLALKTFLNEFVAYEKLSGFMDNRLNCLTEGPTLSPRSEMIATYALCGFSNISAMGVVLGGLGPMAPQRVSDMASVVIRALFGGITVCLITASVAGLLVTELPTEVLLCGLSNATIPGNDTVALSLLTPNNTDLTVNLTSLMTNATAYIPSPV